MKLVVNPGHALNGQIDSDLPGDKSISHRGALFAALAQGESRIKNFLISGVTRAMLNALTVLGISWSLEDSTLLVKGRGLTGIGSPEKPIDCGSSATTMRLLAGALAAAGVPAVLTGSPGLRRRPMRRIVEPLRAMGVPIEASEGGTAPLRLALRRHGEKLSPINYDLPVASAQVKTCILLASLGSVGTTVIREPGPSRDHTERMLASMGVPIASHKPSVPGGHYETQITPPNPCLPTPLHMEIPGDISSAAFLIVAALVTPGSRLTIKRAGLNPTRTGLLDALVSMGADIQTRTCPSNDDEPVGDLTVNSSSLHGIQVDGPLVVRMIDEFPILAVAASTAQGKTVVKDAVELRYKESDRIAVLCQEMTKLGVDLAETDDGFVVSGRQKLPGGTTAHPHKDHRLAMALAISGLAAESPVIVLGAEIIDESFPDFVKILQNLGADMKLED